MQLSLSNFDLEDLYSLSYANTALSFKDKVFGFYKDLDLEILTKEYDYKSAYNEVIREFMALMQEIKENNYKVLIVGDYDCDGISATVIFSRLLNHLKITNNYIIPSRVKDGYGLSLKHVKSAIDYDFDVLVTLDNGIVAYDEIAYAKKHSLKVLVIDHHRFDKLPKADLVVHPAFLKKGFDNLCTGGLVELLSRFYYRDAYNEMLAMCATLADASQVTGYNRQILKEGLRAFCDKQDTPLHLLIKKQKVYTYSDISFKLVPKINAVSRMDPLANVNHLVRYLKDTENINKEQAENITKINELRKLNTQKMADYAAKHVDASKEVILIKSTEFMEGLCGIIAGNLASRYHKPSIVLSDNGNTLKGSARSVNEVDLFDILKDYAAYESYGGHKMAIGLTLAKENYHDFKYFIDHLKPSYHFEKKPLIYLEPDELSVENVRFLSTLAPFGEGLSEPTFYIAHPEILKCFKIQGKYPKYTLKDNVEAIGFDERLYKNGIKALIGKLSLNEFAIVPKINISLEEIVI